MAINRRFRNYAWAVVGYNILVIMWGAFVRATGSGAGCGSHWPLCNGEVIPRAPQIETLIEFSHRVTSGIALFMVVGLLVWAMRAYPKGHIVRPAAVISMIIMIIEALIGAALVLLELVATNVSMARAVWIALHLANTFLLLAALALTAWWASGGAPIRLRGQGRLLAVLLPALIGTLLVGSSGAITALGDTLLRLGALPGTLIRPETDHPIVQLRVIHPILGMLVGAYSLYLAKAAMRFDPSPTSRLLAISTTTIFIGQILLGGLNVTLQAPVWMQMLHLFVADVGWIVLVLLCATLLAVPQAVSERSTPLPRGASAQAGR